MGFQVWESPEVETDEFVLQRSLLRQRSCCQGQAKADNDPAEWKNVPKGECEKMGGKTAAGKKG